MRQRATTLCCALRFRSIPSRSTPSHLKTSRLAALALLGATTTLVPLVTWQSRAVAQETAPPAQAPAAPSVAPTPSTPAAPVQPVPERPAPSPAPAPAAPPPPPAPAAQTTPPATAPAAKATDEAVIDAPAIPYRSVPNFLKLPRDMHMGEASGVATNSEGHIFVFVRGGSSVGPAYGNTASQLWEFDRNGHFLREIGKNLYAWAFAHTVRVDKDDNIWATDKGSDMVVKFNPQGQVEMVFGRKSEAADEGAHPWPHPKPPAPAVDGRFRQPTDVTWDNSGNIYVSDGYINARIAKYDKAGNWVKSWGTHGKGPGQFDLVHAIASDADGNIYVADRNNRRIQVFDGDGNLKRIIHVNVAFPDSAQPAIGNKPNLKDYLKSGGSQTPGAPWTLCITPPPHQVLYTSDSFPGRIYKLSLDGKVLGVLGQSGKQLGQFGWVHEIACPSENTLYVAEILNWRVQKLLLNNASDTSGDTAAPSDRRERRMERREERREQRRRNRYRE